MSYRLGVDVGGTFTDLLLINEETGETHTAKVPSTPEDSSLGVLNGIARDPADGSIWVTGKRWPWMYRIELVPLLNISETNKPQPQRARIAPLYGIEIIPA